MSPGGAVIFDQVRACIAEGLVRVSSHGYDELAADHLYFAELLDGLASGRVVESYPDYPKGPCVLILQQDSQGLPVHVLWGIPRGMRCPVVLVTAYRPDPVRWDVDFMRRAG